MSAGLETMSKQATRNTVSLRSVRRDLEDLGLTVCTVSKVRFKFRDGSTDILGGGGVV